MSTRRGNTIWARTIRERGDHGSTQACTRGLQVTEHMINRLGLETQLDKHYGCVNCLEWNTDGSILASASDDLQVILWDPYKHTPLRTLITAHSGNIFSVKFLSKNLIATCAADATVRVRDIENGLDGDRVCSCHYNRVKRLATSPDCPSMIWSAGEDGFILQHDIRTPHKCNSNSPIVLVNLLNHLGRFAEAKCLAINPRRSEQLAVGANDFYVRVYDRRMIKLANLQNNNSGDWRELPRRDSQRLHYKLYKAGQGDPDNNIPRNCVQYFSPGHLATEEAELALLQKKATTYLTFNSDGTELLVNLGSEQVYLFDINTRRRPILLESYIIQHNHGNKKTTTSTTTIRNGFSVSSSEDSLDEEQKIQESKEMERERERERQQVLPEKVTELKEKANQAVRENQLPLAITLYNEAISRCDNCAILYSNRAAALMRRKWAGDIYAAIRDCYTAINLDPQHVKSHFRLVKALTELHKTREAHECLLYFKDKFPLYSNVSAVKLLEKDINTAMNELDTFEDEVESEESNANTCSLLERQLRTTSTDYSYRFLGHCNTTTDIKEANFLGQDGNFIVAGSDDGAFFIWSRKTGNIIKCLQGDDSIVNCIQVHPTMCLIATSGIESSVKLWSPRPEDGSTEEREVSDVIDAAQANQQRMQADPLEAMLLSMTYQGGYGPRGAGRGPRDGPSGSGGDSSNMRDGPIACRPS